MYLSWKSDLYKLEYIADKPIDVRFLLKTLLMFTLSTFHYLEFGMLFHS